MSKGNTFTFREICDLTGYKASVIRYYEKEFKLDIPRDNNGRRFFSQGDLDKLMYIKNLQDDGYNNSQIKKLLDNQIDTLSEIAVSQENLLILPKNEIPTTIDEKLNHISDAIKKLNDNIGARDTDLLISENLRLKMELKKKGYEIMELKEKLRYEKEGKKSILSNLFGRK